MAVNLWGFIARSKSIVLQQDEVANIEFFRMMLLIIVLLAFALGEYDRVVCIISRILERLSVGVRGF